MSIPITPSFPTLLRRHQEARKSSLALRLGPPCHQAPKAEGTTRGPAELGRGAQRRASHKATALPLFKDHSEVRESELRFFIPFWKGKKKKKTEVRNVGSLFSFRSTTKSSQIHSVAFPRAGVRGRGTWGVHNWGRSFSFARRKDWLHSNVNALDATEMVKMVNFT